MSTINFNLNGPVKVSDENFRIYQREKDYVNPYQALIDWIIRPLKNDDIRRLCLRDLLRQGYQHSHGYHRMNTCYTTVLRLDDCGELYHALCKSEKFRDEFITESMYNINHGLVPSTDDEDKAELIEFLIVLGDKFPHRDLDIERLWRLHPLNRQKASSNPLELAWNELKFCANGMAFRVNYAKPPYRYHAEIWDRLSQTIIASIEECQEDMVKCKSIYTADHPYNPNLIGYIAPPPSSRKLIIRFCEKVITNRRITDRGIELLENHLSPEIQYLTPDCIKETLLSLNDEELAFKCLQRHKSVLLNFITNGDTKKNYRRNRDFLYWMIGLTHHHDLDHGRTNQYLINLLPHLSK